MNGEPGAPETGAGGVVSVLALEGVPEIGPGDNLAALLVADSRAWIVS